MNPQIVSACITCVSFPEELDQVEAMIEQRGTVGYFMNMDGQRILVDVQLKLFAEAELSGQIRQFLGIDQLMPTRRTHRGGEFVTIANDNCLVLGQRGLYVTRDGEFVVSTPDEPLLRTDDLALVDLEQTHRQLMTATS